MTLLDRLSEERTGSADQIAPDKPTRWSVGRHSIIRGDCLTELMVMPAASIDIIVTSPPYNIGVAYKSYNDKRPRESYLGWLKQIGTELARVLKDDGSFFLNVGSTNSDPWITVDVALCFRETFTLQNHITWVKSVSIGDDTVGHFKPISSKRYLNQNHEAVFHFTKTGSVPVDRLAIGVPFKDKSNIARWGHARDKRCTGNVWFIPYSTVKSRAQKFNHPAGFPIDLPERCIKLHGATDALVLDPFLGAGSTLVAVERLGHRGVGIEIDDHYAQAAASRLSCEISDAERNFDDRRSRPVARRTKQGASDNRRGRTREI